MVRTLREMDDAAVVAVASPTPGRAEAFAAEWDIPVPCTSVAALADVGIDAAYIGSSNHRHAGDAAALLAGKLPILCEKPLATTAFETEEMIATAVANQVFMMEAMWMRFLPFWSRLVDLIENDAIGPVRMIRADFGMRAETDPSRRWFNPAQGGGALLDVGIYPVSLAVALAGVPQSIQAAATKTRTGVDAQVGMVFRHDEDVLSILDCSFVADTPISAVVSGPEGRIVLEPVFFNTQQLTLQRGGFDPEIIDVGYEGSGYRFEVEEVHECLAAGQTESTVRPLSDTLEVMKVLDRVRATALG